MSSAALLVLVFAIFAVTGVTALVFNLIDRLTRRRLRSTRYTSELPTWGSLCREAMAREHVRGNRRRTVLVARGFERSHRDNVEATPAVTPEKAPANISRRLPTNS